MSRRQERKNTSFRRRAKIREPYDVVLIVCEDEKTEPNYFNALKNELRLSNANIRICGRECGSAPKSVVEFAKQELKKDPVYDRIFCVFDKDRHETYSKALDMVRSTRLPSGKEIKAITTVPCFEFWLLLHFKDTARPYVPAGGNSACDLVMRDLKKFMPNYEKGQNDVFVKTYGSVDYAITRAKHLEKRQETAGTDNPSTKVHHFLEYLQNLKKKVY